MPREAKLFDASSGSVVRGFLKFSANIPPRWIQNAKASRKRFEPEIARAFGDLKHLRKTRPNARVTIETAVKEFTYYITAYGVPQSNVLRIVEIPDDTVPSAWAPQVTALSSRARC